MTSLVLLRPEDFAAANNSTAMIDKPTSVATAAPIITPKSTKVIEGATPGCYSIEMTNSEYHSLPDSVSCTGLKKLLRSGEHYLAYLDADDQDEGDNLGTAAHAAILEPDVYDSQYVCYEGHRRGNDWLEFKAKNAGKLIQTRVERIQTLGMANALKAFKGFPVWEALRLAQKELSVFWVDEETGIQCRVRFDALNSPFAIWDLKSTTDARESTFLRQAIQLDYDLQVAMYSEAALRFTGREMPFLFIAMETAVPHGIKIYPAGQTMIDNGKAKFRQALNRYKQYMESKQWPGYEHTMKPLELPRYAMVKN